MSIITQVPIKVSILEMMDASDISLPRRGMQGSLWTNNERRSALGLRVKLEAPLRALIRVKVVYS